MSMAGSKIEFFNRKARHEYEILESMETGIVLTGKEIKAIRTGRVNLTGSYAKIIGGEVFWVGGSINVEGEEAQRTRKLLLHQEQISRLIGKSQEQGLTLLPLKLYVKRGRAKLELGVGRGLKKVDKRQKLKEQDQRREIDRNLKRG